MEKDLFMHVLVTGATGFIGSAVVRELLEAGHKVTGLARSDAAATALTAAGAEVHRAALDDLDGLREAAAASDGVIHTAYTRDAPRYEETTLSQYEYAAHTDRRAIKALGSALEGSDRPLVVTSGTLALKPGAVGTERDLLVLDPDSPAAARLPNEQVALSLASRGVRSSVVRLSPTVHGEEDRGFMPALIGIARSKGVSGYVGDGANRWPAVHRLDAARLFRLALEKAPAGTVLHGAAEQGVLIRDIAEVIGRRLDLPTASISQDEAGEHFGWLGGFLGMDVPVSSALTRELLGWQPAHAGLLDDLSRGHYFHAPSV
jgi:nucleoside-diphosphate-sugar epimerase